MEDDDYKGCLLCIHGKFIASDAGNYPQNVDCKIFGIIKEKTNCDNQRTEPILVMEIP